MVLARTFPDCRVEAIVVAVWVEEEGHRRPTPPPQLPHLHSLPRLVAVAVYYLTCFIPHTISLA